jgi:hypothetical protein
MGVQWGLPGGHNGNPGLARFSRYRSEFMPNKEDILLEKTHKNDGIELEKRVFLTLSDEKGHEHHRNTMALARLVKLLHEKKQLSDEEVDELLLQCVW